MWQVICADVLAWCKSYTGEPFHAILTDPPYALKFMNKAWDDNIAFQPETWAALAEHLLPGGFVMAFASSRGWHRLACAMEDAGLIIQPSIFGWVNGQSFPKATRIDTQIDKAAGAIRKVIGREDSRSRYDGSNRKERAKYTGIWNNGEIGGNSAYDITIPITDLARAWQGHRYGGQILKNALEPIICAQKPWEGKRLDCIVETGAGSLWVDGGRIGISKRTPASPAQQTQGHGIYGSYKPRDRTVSGMNGNIGRWPSNFVLCHSEGCERVGVKRVKGSIGGVSGVNAFGQDSGWNEHNNRPTQIRRPTDPDGMETVDEWRCEENCPARKLGKQSGERPPPWGKGKSESKTKSWKQSSATRPIDNSQYRDTGTAARFFYQADWSHEIAERITSADPVRYCPKAARKERDAGLEEFKAQYNDWQRESSGLSQGKNPSTGERSGNRCNPIRNPHPTVKPISLNKWLATLLLPPSEYAPRRILVPFAGTMSEGIGAMLAGWEEIIGIDFEPSYCKVGEARMKYWFEQQGDQQLTLF